MKWRKYWCRYCKKMTAYAKGGKINSNDILFGCDECGSTWEETIIGNPQNDIQHRKVKMVHCGGTGLR